MAKKIQVCFSEKQMELLENLKGELGITDADIVRNIVLAWLSEKGLISTAIQQRMRAEYKGTTHHE